MRSVHSTIGKGFQQKTNVRKHKRWGVTDLLDCRGVETLRKGLGSSGAGGDIDEERDERGSRHRESKRTKKEGGNSLSAKELLSRYSQ